MYRVKWHYGNCIYIREFAEGKDARLFWRTFASGARIASMHFDGVCIRLKGRDV